MAWQEYRERFKTQPMAESHFVLGIDLGNAMSSIAYFDALRQSAEVIDMSGGYGKAAVPTVLQFAPDTGEWIFGEYAMLNQGLGREQTFTALMEQLGHGADAEVNGHPISTTQMLGLYCKELVAACKNLNPKAEIAGIAAAMPSYMNDAAQANLREAFREAGLADDIIAFLPGREGIFRQYYYGRTPAEETVLLLDFGDRALRGGIYDVHPEADGIALDCVSSMFDDAHGMAALTARVQDWFTDFYCAQTSIAHDALSPQVRSQLAVFTYQHKDLLFRTSMTHSAKPAKLYYNFAYPPMQQTVTAQDVQTLTAPFAAAFKRFIQDLLSKTLRADSPLAHDSIQTVLCTGGGFEMLQIWAQTLVREAFPSSNVVFFKNAKDVIAEGASLAAAAQLGLLPPFNIRLTDRHVLTADIGVKVLRRQEELFVPLVPRGSFWWQKQASVCFLLNEPAGTQATAIELFRRNDSGTQPLATAVLDGLPARPAGTTKLAMTFQFEAHDRLTVAVADAGFGELFPKTDFAQTFSFPIPTDR